MNWYLQCWWGKQLWYLHPWKHQVQRVSGGNLHVLHILHILQILHVLHILKKGLISSVPASPEHFKHLPQERRPSFAFNPAEKERQQRGKNGLSPFSVGILTCWHVKSFKTWLHDQKCAPLKYFTHCMFHYCQASSVCLFICKPQLLTIFILLPVLYLSFTHTIFILLPIPFN